MSKILMKLKEDSTKDFLTTFSGFIIKKDKFRLVDDDDSTIHSYIINRNDIEIKEYEEEVKVENKMKRINEGNVKNTIIDNEVEEEKQDEENTENQ